MKPAAKKVKDENYKPNQVPKAFKVINGQLDLEKDPKLSRDILANTSVGRDSAIDLMTLVQLPAIDLEKTVRFYVDILGLALDYPERPLKVNSFLSTIPRIGPGLHILETPVSEFRHLHGNINGKLKEYVAFYVKDINTLYERLLKKNTRIVGHPMNGYMSFLDPEGHLIGVYERTDSQINEEFKSNITGFRHVQMFVTDIELAVTFFEKALCFERDMAVEPVVGECYLRVREGETNQPLIRLKQTEEESAQPMHWMLEGFPKHAVELHSKNIRLLSEQIVKYGGVMKEELEYTGCGGYLKFYTPDGHYIWVNQDIRYVDK